jgi:hypothetical protein
LKLLVAVLCLSSVWSLDQSEFFGKLAESEFGQTIIETLQLELS